MRLQRETEKLSDEIMNELTRLDCGVEYDPYYGLMTKCPNVVMNILPIVAIYNDFVEGFYDARSVLLHLQTLKPGETTLEPECSTNIWQQLDPFEV
jgi:hypothetical protein